MSSLQRVGVFCGSRSGVGTRYVTLARACGRAFAQAGLGLVYGGGSVGLMGALADATLQAGGEVTGVIPEGLAVCEGMHRGLTELHVVQSMHARKALMAELSDAFVALPGGIGTLDELFEIVTWSQLKLHDKPIYLMNEFDFYEPLLAMTDFMAHEGFADPNLRRRLVVMPNLDALMEQLAPTVSMQRAHG